MYREGQLPCKICTRLDLTPHFLNAPHLLTFYFSALCPPSFHLSFLSSSPFSFLLKGVSLLPSLALNCWVQVIFPLSLLSSWDLSGAPRCQPFFLLKITSFFSMSSLFFLPSFLPPRLFLKQWRPCLRADSVRAG